MSGNFTQRGLPAMLDKRLRAAMAVDCGIDLVLELPFVYAANNAEYFAHGAVRILDGLGVVDHLSFGSESGDADALSRVARLFADDSDSLNAAVREGMSGGVSYPAARERAVAALLGGRAAALMKEPNNILAIEYLKELRLLGSDIAPLTVKRHAAGVADADDSAGIAGATAIREMFRSVCVGEGRLWCNGNAAVDVDKTVAFDGEAGADIRYGDAHDPYGFLPACSADAIREYLAGGGSLVFDDALFPYLVYAVIMAERAGGSLLPEILSATEGLENRLISAVHRAANMYEAVRYTKTRRYTETRVRRLILHTIAALTKESMAAAKAEPLYARVLAFNNVGAKLIRRVKNIGNIPVISNANREKTQLVPSQITFSFDIKAAELYRLLQAKNIAGFNEYTARYGL
jgi:predicted nucleotidyltransferase